MLRAREGLPPGVLSADGTVACRVSPSSTATGIVRALGEPLVATSANRAGEPAPASFEKALEGVGSDVALAIDGGELEGRLGSTLVDVTSDPPRVLRRGDLDVALPRG